VENAEVRLAAWRVYGTAEKLHHIRGNTRRANICQYKKQQAVRKLADSLPDADSLRDHLWHFIGMNAPAAIDGAVPAMQLPAAFNVSLVDAA
jgi:hypothetical protein